MQTEINQGDTSAEVITPPKESSIVSGAIAATAPGKLRVIKRNGTVVPFEASKISRSRRWHGSRIQPHP